MTAVTKTLQMIDKCAFLTDNELIDLEVNLHATINSLDLIGVFTSETTIELLKHERLITIYGMPHLYIICHRLLDISSSLCICILIEACILYYR